MVYGNKKTEFDRLLTMQRRDALHLEGNKQVWGPSSQSSLLHQVMALKQINGNMKTYGEGNVVIPVYEEDQSVLDLLEEPVAPTLLTCEYLNLEELENGTMLSDNLL